MKKNSSNSLFSISTKNNKWLAVGPLLFSWMTTCCSGFLPSVATRQYCPTAFSIATPWRPILASQVMEEPSVEPSSSSSYQQQQQQPGVGVTTTTKSDNKAMAFLRKIGKVGGGTSAEFSQAMGVDEGPSGKVQRTTAIRKCKSSYQICTETGIIDDLSESFPWTSSGTEWIGVTDRVMGGCSSGSLSREVVDGQVANVLRGQVALLPNNSDRGAGFVQMATNLGWDPAVSFAVDASDYDGIELDVLYQGTAPQEKYNVHLKTTACMRQFSSYRAMFQIPSDQWTTVRLSWSDFLGYGPGANETPLDITNIRRLGVVAIGKEMDVFLAVAGVRLYSVI